LKTTTKYGIFILKLLIALSAAAFVGWKITEIFQENNVSAVHWSRHTPWFVCITLILSFLNWFLEAIKWRHLIQDMRQLSYLTALKHVLQGVTTAIITPNRMGSFIGRIANLHPSERVKGTLITLLAGIAQFSVTVTFGAIGFFLLTDQFNWTLPIWSVAILVLFLLLGWMLYFKPALFLRTPASRLFSAKWKADITFIDHLPKAKKFNVLFWSLLRFLTFSIQYVLILKSLQSNSSNWELWLNVCVVYGMMTVLPGLLFGKLMVREASALLIFSTIGITDLEILLAGFIVWVINIGLPALFGGFFMMRQKQWFHRTTEEL